jgi:triacylglycerol lipase
MREKLRGLAGAGLAVLLVVAAGCATIRPTGPPTTQTPVIFVHGWSASPSMWDTAVATFRNAGYSSGDITVLSYDSGLSARDAAQQLAAEVDHLRSYTGQSSVDVVSHSYGSMVTKYCIELGSCAGKVDHWMSLAGADNGTAFALACSGFQASCADMAGQTTTIADLQAAWPQLVGQGVEVEAQWSPNDGIIIPAENSREPAPATNVQLTGGQAHLDIPDDPGVLAETIAFFRR